MRWTDIPGGAAILVSAAILVAAVGAAAWACGDYYPNRALVQAESDLTRLPDRSFVGDLERLAQRLPTRVQGPVARSSSARDSDQTDVDDLDRVLRAAQWSAADRNRLVERYAGVRLKVNAHRERRAAWDWKHRAEGRALRGAPRLDDVRVPGGLPWEFDLYLRGALAYHADRFEDAAHHWERLLRLPEADRMERTVWASYMLGRAQVLRRPARAIRWFKRTRREAHRGLPDALDLAAASIGWEARAELERRRFGRAAELYLDALARGDWHAASSLQRVAREVVKRGPSELRRAARNPALRGVITAYVASRGELRGHQPEPPDLGLVTAWLEAVEAAAPDEVDQAEVLASIAYQHGAYDVAERWLIRAPSDSIVAREVAARLALRSGDLDGAASEYAQLAHRHAAETPAGEFSHAASAANDRLANVRMAQGRYEEALDALIVSESWLDQVYIAEHVLTVDELTSYLGRRPAVGVDHSVRSALGRRLVRLGRFDAAREYLHERVHARLDALSTSLADGRDPNLDVAARAAALRTAATMLAEHGTELVATDSAPDWRSKPREYWEPSSAASIRAAVHGSVGRLGASDDELRRVRAHAVQPDVRFHFRYRALALALDAAELMPAEREETAEWIVDATHWVAFKHWEPERLATNLRARALDLLLRRCGSTELGSAARSSGSLPASPGSDEEDE